MVVRAVLGISFTDQELMDIPIDVGYDMISNFTNTKHIFVLAKLFTTDFTHVSVPSEDIATFLSIMGSHGIYKNLELHVLE